MESSAENTKIIYVSGKIDYGKTNITSLIQNELYDYAAERDYHVTRFSFGDKVKEIARQYMFWDEEKDDRGRQLLTDIGHVAGRGYDSNIWVKHFNAFLKRYVDMINEEGFFAGDAIDDKYYRLLCFVDDWRYENEYDNPQIRRNKIPDDNKYGIRISRNVEETSQHDHPSEKQLSDDPNDYEFFLENNYESFEELRKSTQFNDLISKLKTFINE